MPLQPILALEPFQKWGLYFMGSINPPATNTRNRYIRVYTTDCAANWVEEVALRGTIRLLLLQTLAPLA